MDPPGSLLGPQSAWGPMQRPGSPGDLLPDPWAEPCVDLGSPGISLIPGEPLHPHCSILGSLIRAGIPLRRSGTSRDLPSRPLAAAPLLDPRHLIPFPDPAAPSGGVCSARTCPPPARTSPPASRRGHPTNSVPWTSRYWGWGSDPGGSGSARRDRGIPSNPRRNASTCCWSCSATSPAGLSTASPALR